MMSREQNDQLSRIGPGTLMGKLLRRYWAPFLLAAEIPEPDCPPVRVKLMGESLIAFRDSKGRIGLIDEFCAHRGVSLWFGENEECGMRCPYHGWKYDVTGQCVDLPSEPEESGFRKNIKLKSYPCIEKAGIIWAYMGPPELAAAAAGAGMDRGQARAALRLQAAAGMQLPAGDGRRHRFQPRVVAARQRAQQGSAVQGQQGQRVQREGPHAAVRGGGISRRPADRRAPQCRRRQILLAHHALDHALVLDHPAARRPSARRARLGADRRRDLLGLEHQLSSQARADEIGSLGHAGRRGHPRQIRARHLHSARQQVQQLSDGPQGAAPRPLRHRRRRHRHAGCLDPGKHGRDPGPHQGASVRDRRRHRHDAQADAARGQGRGRRQAGAGDRAGGAARALGGDRARPKGQSFTQGAKHGLYAALGTDPLSV